VTSATPAYGLSPRWRAAVAAFPLVFLPHEIEEALLAARTDEMVRDLDAALRRRLGDRSPDLAARYQTHLALTTEQGPRMVAITAALGAAAAWPVALRPRPGRALELFAAVTGLRLVNAVMHVVQSAVTRRYAPGTSTGLLIAVPYSLLTLRALRRAGLLTRWQVLRTTLAGLALLPAAAVVLRLASRRRIR
jgi:hypothetical protein